MMWSNVKVTNTSTSKCNVNLLPSFWVIILSSIISITSAFADLGSAPRHPDLAATPGDFCTVKNPDFSGYRYRSRIAYCKRNVSSETKVKVYEYYNVPLEKRRFYTIDHLIPLSIGGSNEEKNLWPEHKQIKATRLNLENEIFEAVKTGALTQTVAAEHILQEKMNPNLGE